MFISSSFTTATPNTKNVYPHCHPRLIQADAFSENLTNADEWNDWAVSVYTNCTQVSQGKSDSVLSQQFLSGNGETCHAYFPREVLASNRSFFEDRIDIIHNPSVFPDLPEDNKDPDLGRHEDTRRYSISLSSSLRQHATATIKGNNKDTKRMKIEVNQDRALVVHCHEDEKGAPEHSWWMGLLDGHGQYGHVVAQLALFEIPKLIFNELSRIVPLRDSASSQQSANDGDEKAANIPKILSESFQAIQHGILSQNNNISDNSGAVAVSFFHYHKKLYVSHLGDAHAIVIGCSDNESRPVAKILYEAKAHKPMDPDERERIVKSGGSPYYTSKHPMDVSKSRFEFPAGKKKDTLGMSRSFGNLQTEPYGMIAVPTTHVLSVNTLTHLCDDCQRFIAIAASDGLTHALENKMSWLTHMCATSTIALAVDEVITKAAMIWIDDNYHDNYRDDITLTAHELLTR